MRRINFWLNCLELSGTGISEPDLLKLTRGSFKRRVLLRIGMRAHPTTESSSNVPPTSEESIHDQTISSSN